VNAAWTPPRAGANPVLGSALRIFEETGYPVTPCDANKRPICTDWTNLKPRSCEEIKALFAGTAAQLVGVLTGEPSGFFAVDVDPAGGPWLTENFVRLECKRIHSTRREGGRHLFYAIPAGWRIKNSAGKIAPGVDTRGNGGQIIWWPEHGGRAVEDDAPGLPPQWLLDELARLGIAERLDKPRSNGNGHAHAAGMKEGPGRRNVTLTSLAGSMRRAGFSTAAISEALHRENYQRFDPPLPAAEVNAICESAQKWQQGTVNAGNGKIEEKPIILRPVHEIVAEQREPAWLIHKIIEANVLAVIAGPRSSFKSFVALDWAMRMALDGHAGVILSGEGAGLDRRIAAWMNWHRENVDLNTVPLVALERPLNLNSPIELTALRAAITRLPKPPAFVLVDTFSKFSAGLDENDNGQVAAFLSALSGALREELRCTVLLVAHTGHGDAKRPRGASALMANPDAEYICERPDPNGMTVTVTRDRFKDAPSLPPLAYEAKVIDLGRLDAYGEAVTSLALISTNAPAPKPKVKGANQEKAITALKEWARVNPDAGHISSVDMRDVLKAQGLTYKRRPEVLTHLVTIRVLTPSVGGYTIDRLML
jgi:hypothetical protein